MTELVNSSSRRIHSIDILRGLVMVIMALDHVRDFYNPTPFQPEDISQTSVPLFFTRWITHFCAPTFIFLSGASAFLYGQKHTTSQLSRFLLTRGLWLVVLETILFPLIFQRSYQMVFLIILWAIGTSMILLAGLVWLPRKVILGFALLVIFGHNLIPNIQNVTFSNLLPAMLHNGPFVIMAGPLPILFSYTILPWTAVMALGYSLGPWFVNHQKQRFLQTGLIFLALFVILRAINVYGDPVPWTTQSRGTEFTFLSFLNVAKYPPSLLFICLTLGVSCTLLYLLDTVQNPLTDFFEVYGRVPFFYYLLHFSLISISAFVWAKVSFGIVTNLSFMQPKDWPAGYHPSLLRNYLAWLVLVLALYYPCRWFGQYKKTHSYKWLSYL